MRQESARKREYNRGYGLKARVAWDAAGLCKRCGREPRVEGKKACQSCLDYKKAWYHAHKGHSRKKGENAVRCEACGRFVKKGTGNLCLNCAGGHKRPCHDCGKLTENYRCQSCQDAWRKKYGISPDTDEMDTYDVASRA